jgi:hypothetical protein
VHSVYFSIDEPVHGVDVLLDLLVAAVDGRHSVELVLQPPEDAVGAQQLLLGLAVQRNAGVVLQASNGVLRTDQQGVGVQGLRQGLSGLDHFAADGVGLTG